MMMYSLSLFTLAVSCIVANGFNLEELVRKMMVTTKEEISHESNNVIRSFDNHQIFDYLHKNFKGNPKKPVLFKSFDWSDCGSSNEIAKIARIDVSPDPVILPGSLNVSFSVGLKETVDAPLKMELKLEKDTFFGWVTIPCIDGIGSCTLDDVCDKLVGDQCPPEFIHHNIPCKCPFPQGQYDFPRASYSIHQSVPHGKYKATVRLSQSGKPVSCINVNADIE